MKDQSLPTFPASLPVRGSFFFAYMLSIGVTLLMALASVIGILDRTILYPTDKLLQTFVPNDVVNLLIGLPILVGSMWLTRRGRLIGLLLWPGALLFVLYNYIAYISAVPPSWISLLYLALVAGSLCSTICLARIMDGDAIHQQLEAAAIPSKFGGGVLVGLGALFLLRAIGVIASAALQKAPLAATDLGTLLADLIITPCWVICGLMVWRRQAFGFVAGLGLLFQASMLFVALIVFMLLQPLVTGTPFHLADVIVIFSMGLICFIPFALFARGVTIQGNNVE